MNAAHLGEDASAMIADYLELEASLDSDSKRLARLRNQLVSVAGQAEFLITTDGQWFSFKSARGGKRKLKPHRGKVRVQ